MNPAAALRRMINRKGSFIVPGVYDALSAKIADHLGFQVLFHTGYGTAASLLALPDIGMISFKEMLDRVESICRTTNKPVIADADTGYGNAINVMRTVRDYIHAGAAALILEDQVWPKRCGHMKGKSVIPVEEMYGKIRAAVEARDELGSDLVLVGRTDSFAIGGIDEAIQRVKTFKKAGADVLFIEAPMEIADLVEIAKSVNTPLLLNQIEGGKTPILPAKEAEKLGFKILLYPLTSLFAAARNVFDVMEYLKRHGNTEGIENKMISFEGFNELLESEKYFELEKRYAGVRPTTAMNGKGS